MALSDFFNIAAVLATLLVSLQQVNGRSLGVYCDRKAYILLTDVGLPVRFHTSLFAGSKQPYAVIASGDAPPLKWMLCVWTRTGESMLTPFDSPGFLSRCTNCYDKNTFGKQDSAFITPSRDLPEARWTVEEIPRRRGSDVSFQGGNGKVVAFKAGNGKYLARCLGCVEGHGDTNFLFVHETSSAVSHAQFRLVPVVS